MSFDSFHRFEGGFDTYLLANDNNHVNRLMNIKRESIRYLFDVGFNPV